MVFPHLSLLVHLWNSARENDLNSTLESIINIFWSQKHETLALPTKSDSSTDLGQCEGFISTCNSARRCEMSSGKISINLHSIAVLRFCSVAVLQYCVIAVLRCCSVAFYLYTSTWLVSYKLINLPIPKFYATLQNLALWLVSLGTNLVLGPPEKFL